MKKFLAFLLCVSCKQLIAAEQPEQDFLAEKQYEACMKYLATLDPSKSEYKVIVELGCSTARVSHKLAKGYPEKLIVGIDYNQKAIAQAVNRCSDQANVVCIYDTVQKYDLKTYGLPLANLTTCYHLLHWIEPNELSMLFANITKNLALNGIVDISTPTKQEECCITRATQDTLIFDPQWNRYSMPFLSHAITAQENISYISTEKLKELALDVHLDILLCEKKEEAYYFRSHKEFRSFLHSCLRYYGIDNFMDARIQLRFIKDVSRRYQEKYNRSEDPKQIAYTFFSLHLTAQKK